MSCAATSARSSLFTAGFMFGSSVIEKTPRWFNVSTTPPNVSKPAGNMSVPDELRFQLTCAFVSPGAVIVNCLLEIESVTLVAVCPVY